jgi:hypothetical protein
MAYPDNFTSESFDRAWGYTETSQEMIEDLNSLDMAAKAAQSVKDIASVYLWYQTPNSKAYVCLCSFLELLRDIVDDLHSDTLKDSARNLLSFLDEKPENLAFDDFTVKDLGVNMFKKIEGKVWDNPLSYGYEV